MRITFSAINQAVNGDRKRRVISRISALTLAAYLLTLIAPTMADESTPPIDGPVVALAPIDSLSPTPEPAIVASPSESALPLTPDASAAPTDTASASPSPTKVHALTNQNMSIHLPLELQVDPRARSLFLPQLNVQNVGTLLVCINGSSLGFDVNEKGVNDTSNFDKDSLAGDLTSSLRIAGSNSFAISMLNNGGGLRAFTSSNRVAGQSITFRFVAISEPSVNAELCSEGSVSNNRTVHISELGIDLDMKKGDVTLKR